MRHLDLTRALLLATVCGMGCLPATGIPCGSGVCPSDTVCAPITPVCVAPEQVVACIGKEPLAACTYLDGSDGLCAEEVCIQPCGNGDTEPEFGEVCDDGNTMSGDDCSSDCRSDETCGNGLLDQSTGDQSTDEQCDDGNQLSHDGCTAGCQQEQPQWLLRTELRPSARGGLAMAYDARRGRVVMFGGDGLGDDNGNALAPGTWEWGGRRWNNVSPEVGDPVGRVHHAMAYDAKREVVVLFGGLDAVGGDYKQDTWTWDGTSWTNIMPTMFPSPRQYHAMAFDAGRGKLVLFGGFDAMGRLNDTWEWDGAEWQQITPASQTPTARHKHTMAYDASRGRVVMFGGDAGGLANDIWEWDGTSWTPVMPAPGSEPSGRWNSTLVYDAHRQRTVLFGGTDGDYLDDVWEWDGAAWSERVPLGTPLPPRRSHGMAYDIARGEVVVFGGYDGDPLADTWSWSGQQWRQTGMANAPDVVSGYALSYDSARGRIVLFGGSDSSFPAELSSDTWEWTEDTWTRVSPAAPPPPARKSHGMAYDAVAGHTILFGGTDDNQRLDDSWAWDGIAWTPMFLSGKSPPPRQSHAMIYDAMRDRVVLFGGRDGPTIYADTWEWDGEGWRDVTPIAGSPPSRHGHTMVFDPVRGRTVLFGGRGESVYDDLWEWDGTTWEPREGAQDSPSAHTSHAMAFDARRRSVVMFGGTSSQQTWEWNGIAWSESAVSGGPTSGVMSYNAASGHSVLFDGSDTWIYHHANAGQPEERCLSGTDTDGDGLAGCADPDCWGYCEPNCPPGAECNSAAARCGDSVCNQSLESCHLCPQDCGTCVATCGDYVCGPDESSASCPGDCQGGQ